MTMTIDSIDRLDSLREQARVSKLHDLRVYVPEDGDPSYPDESYIFFTEARDTHWWDITNFQQAAQRLLGGTVFVMHRNALDSVEVVQADTNAIPILK
jgi:hypothetical protein